MTTSSFMRIGTHDGSFHADDVLAVAILTTIYPNHQIVRSRDTDILNMMDILIDVGDIYDHRIKRYDHHMHNPPKDKFDHMFSSAGLIWRHYAKTYLEAIGIPKDFTFEGNTFGLITSVERHIRIHWIHPIDRADNGLNQGPTAISEIVRSMRPIHPERSTQRFDQLFLEAVSMVSHIFKRSCFHSADHVIAKTQCMHSEKKILLDDKVIVSQYPFHNYKVLNTTTAHFSICPSDVYEGSELYFVVRPILDLNTKSFKTPFPAEILGCRSATIEQHLGIKGVNYIHHNGHLALVNSEEEAISLCKKLLGYNETNS